VSPWPRRRRTAAAAAYARAQLPSGRTAWAAASWCAVDLELSGLDPRRHEIISFAAIPIEQGRIQLARATAGLVRPLRALEEASIRIHGLRAADLLDAPPLEEAIGPLLEAMAGRLLVAHVAQVEQAFLGRALRSQGLRLRGPVADTSVIGRLWLGERDGRVPRETSLHDLARALGLPAHAEHDAFADALAAAQLFIAAASHLDVLGGETVRSLTSADRRLRGAIAHPGGAR
jgi:DNA polymerase III subunit epsilon